MAMSFDFMAIWDNKDILLNGVMTTLIVSLVTIPVAIAIGVVTCLMRISKRTSLRWFAISYIELMRNIPFLILIFMVFYALPFYGYRLSGLSTGFVCLSIYGGAYFAEVFRGGIEAFFQISPAAGLEPNTSHES